MLQHIFIYILNIYTYLYCYQSKKGLKLLETSEGIMSVEYLIQTMVYESS